MNNKYFTIIVVILGLILLGIFTTWLLVSRGYVNLSSPVSNPTSTSTASNSIFPTGDSGPGSSGDSSNTIFQPTSTSTSNILLSGGQTDKLLAKLDTKPIGALLSVGRGTSTVLFFERITGNLFQLPPSGSPFRVSNTTLPRVVNAWGGISATTTNFIIRTNNEKLETKLASFTSSSASSTSESLFLGGEEEVGGDLQTLTLRSAPSAAFDFATSPVGNQLATLERTGSGTDLVINNWKGNKREVAASFPLTQLSISWPASTTIAIQTRASYAADGFLYFYNTKTKKLDQIVAGVKGLAAKASPDANYVLYSGSATNGFFSAIYDRKTGKITRLPFKTLAEKCVWGSDSDTIYCGVPSKSSEGNYPDLWYQGLAQFADNLWQLDIASKRATILFNPELNNLGENIDATQLTLDAVNKQLYFVNKNDFSLWRLSLGTSF